MNTANATLPMLLRWPAPGEVHVCCACLNQDDDAVTRAGSLLSVEELEHASGLRVQLARNSFVVCRGVLRNLLSRCCGTRPEDIDFGYGPNGKPFLKGGPRQLHFSVSHSGEIAAYAFTLDGPVGIDVEVCRPMPDMLTIASRYFSSSEYKELLRVSEHERQTAFFNCWVRKEAYVKALGGGLSIPLDSFSVSVAPSEPASLLGALGDGDEGRAWQLIDFSPAAGYCGAVAVRSRLSSLHLHEIRPAIELLLPDSSLDR